MNRSSNWTLLVKTNCYKKEMIDKALHKRTKPLIFSNAIAHWKAMSWNPVYFKENFGDVEVAAYLDLPDHDNPYLHKLETYFSASKVSTVVELMLANKRCYIAQENLDSFHGLSEDFNFHDLVPDSVSLSKLVTNIWMGANTKSGLHFDIRDNFLAQIYGRKKVVLISPQNTKYIYPIPDNFTKSFINPFNVDDEKFPKFKKAQILYGEISPGDVLYIPSGWWHYIASMEPSISINCWYGHYYTFKEYVTAFLRCGFKSSAIFIRDFLWYGLCNRPYHLRLFSPPPFGKIAYKAFLQKIKFES